MVSLAIDFEPCKSIGVWPNHLINEDFFLFQLEDATFLQILFWWCWFQVIVTTWFKFRLIRLNRFFANNLFKLTEICVIPFFCRFDKHFGTLYSVQFLKWNVIVKYSVWFDIGGVFFFCIKYDLELFEKKRCSQMYSFLQHSCPEQ